MSSLLSVPFVALAVLVLGIVGYFLAGSRVRASAEGDLAVLHSRPVFHSWSVLLTTIVPSLLFLFIWAFLQGLISNNYVSSTIPSDLPELRLPLAERAELTDEQIDIRERSNRQLFFGRAKTLATALDGAVDSGALDNDEIASWRADLVPIAERLEGAGQIVGGDVSQGLFDTAQRLRSLSGRLSLIGPIVAAALAVIGFAWSLSRIGRDFRARNVVEKWVMSFLVFASATAILTTIGILAAVTLPSLTFFREYGFWNFISGLNWAPPTGEVVGFPSGEDGEYRPLLGLPPADLGHHVHLGRGTDRRCATWHSGGDLPE